MEVGSVLGGCQLLQMLHQTSDRTIWKGIHQSTGLPVVIRISPFNSKHQSVPFPLNWKPLYTTNKLTDLPFLVSEVLIENYRYLLQAKKQISGQNIYNWVQSRVTEQEQIRVSQELQNQLGVLVGVVKKVRLFVSLGLCCCSISAQNVLIDEDNIVVLGCWYTLKENVDKKMLQIVGDCLHSQKSDPPSTIKNLVSLGLDLIGSTKISQGMGGQIDQDKKQKVMAALQKIDRKSEEVTLQELERQLNGLLMSVYIFKMPLRSQYSKEQDIVSFKGQRRFEAVSKTSKIIFKLGIIRNQDIILVTVDKPPQRIAYNKQSLPLALNQRFDTLKELYHYIRLQKQLIVVEDGNICLLTQNQKETGEPEQHIPASQSKAGEQKKETKQIVLRQCQFYEVEKAPDKPSGLKGYKSSIDDELLRRIEGKLEVLQKLNVDRQGCQEKDVKVYQFLGVENFKKGNYIKALEYYQLALEMCQQLSSSSNSSQMASIHYNIALNYHHMQKHQQALTFCLFVLEAPQQQPLLPLTLLINILSYGLGDYKEASYYINQGLKVVASAQELAAASFFNSAGVVMVEMQAFESAISYLQKAKRIYQKTQVNNNEEWVMCSINLAGAYSFSGRTIEALETLKFQAEVMRSVNDEVREEVFKIMLRLAKATKSTTFEEQTKVKIGDILTFSGMTSSQYTPSLLLEYCP